MYFESKHMSLSQGGGERGGEEESPVGSASSGQNLKKGVDS